MVCSMLATCSLCSGLITGVVFMLAELGQCAVDLLHYCDFLSFLAQLHFLCTALFHFLLH